MSDHLLRTIGDLETDIHAREQKVMELKRSVNVLCGMAQIAPKYDNVDSIVGSSKPSITTIKADQFVNTALNTAVKDYLTMRKASGVEQCASAEEILSALEQGGYEFDGKDKGANLNGLRISLGKSSHTFKKIGNGKYGLNDWYGITGRQTRPKLPESAASAPAAEVPDAPEVPAEE